LALPAQAQETEADDPPDIVQNNDEALGEWLGTEWQWTRRIMDRHTLIIGGEYRENIRQHQVNYDVVEPRAYALDSDHSSRTLGLFAQLEVALLTNLVLNAGIRYDHYFDSFGGTVNPRLGLIYNPWKTGAFKLLYGEAFRAPNAYEQFYYSEERAFAELKPETIRTCELIYEQYIARRYRCSLSGYYYTVKDLISQITTPEDELTFANVDGAHAAGAELELEAKYDSGLMARASYALQRTHDQNGNELTSSPRQLAKLNLIVPLYRDKLFSSLELQYQSSARTLQGNHVKNFVTANFTLFSQKIVAGLEASASIHNLFDQRTGYPGAADHLQDVINQDGRSFRFKLTYRF
ncbi:MAG: TonB-dependent receptor, partial [Akkermansiaceae bacterium]|nr:TonB-dependent receptor [Verrucomicrobiales bacterium]